MPCGNYDSTVLAPLTVAAIRKVVLSMYHRRHDSWTDAGIAELLPVLAAFNITTIKPLRRMMKWHRRALLQEERVKMRRGADCTCWLRQALVTSHVDETAWRGACPLGVAARPGHHRAPSHRAVLLQPVHPSARSMTMVNPVAQAHRGLGTTLFSLLNPIPFGFFVAGLIFDILYLNTAEVMWGKSAAWLITFGLLIAILPRLINLFAVWRRNGTATGIDRLDFLLNLVAIVLAIWNAFVHSRDAYAVAVPGTLLSALTVALIALGFILLSLQQPVLQGARHG